MTKVINNYYIQVPMANCLIPPTPPTTLPLIKGPQSRIILLDMETAYPTMDFRHYQGDLDTLIDTESINKYVYLRVSNILADYYSDKDFTIILWYEGKLVTLLNCVYKHWSNDRSVFNYKYMVIGAREQL